MFVPYLAVVVFAAVSFGLLSPVVPLASRRVLPSPDVENGVQQPQPQEEGALSIALNQSPRATDGGPAVRGVSVFVRSSVDPEREHQRQDGAIDAQDVGVTEERVSGTSVWRRASSWGEWARSFARERRICWSEGVCVVLALGPVLSGLLAQSIHFLVCVTSHSCPSVRPGISCLAWAYHFLTHHIHCVYYLLPPPPPPLPTVN